MTNGYERRKGMRGSLYEEDLVQEADRVSGKPESRLLILLPILIPPLGRLENPL